MADASLAGEFDDDAALRAHLSKFPYDKRWDVLRPIIEHLFYTETVKYISELVKDRWGFKADVSHYKYRFNKVWHLNKNVPEKVKDAARRKAIARAKHGKGTIAKYRGRPIPVDRLQSNMSMSQALSTMTLGQLFTAPLARLEFLGRYTPHGNNLLVAWNMPHGTLPAVKYVSSPGPYGHSPSDVIMGGTPGEFEALTPSVTGNSPDATAMTGVVDGDMSLAVRERRAALFVRGEFDQLLPSLSAQERSDLSMHLYRFWQSCFVAAQQWSPYSQPRLLPPQDIDELTSNASTGQHTEFAPPGVTPAEIPAPPEVCGWAIHVEDLTRVIHIPDEEDPSIAIPPDSVDPPVAFNQAMREALATDSFTDVPSANLAFPLASLVTRTCGNEHDMLGEAINFAVMSGNLDLLREILSKVYNRKQEMNIDDHERCRGNVLEDLNIDLVQSLHLALSYLNGASVCCLIVMEILKAAIELKAFRINTFTNQNGHTLIDSLLLTILRSHSDVPLHHLDTSLARSARYCGQEVDICGRWTASSPCYRGLLAIGYTEIPFKWKHRFCRTSIQAACHSLRALVGLLPMLQGQDSGLFIHWCPNEECSQRLSLGPLHALIMTAYHIMVSGMKGEDLFGILACYLCLVDAGVDPLTQKVVSIQQLLRIDSARVCTHSLQTAGEMAGNLLDLLELSSIPEALLEAYSGLMSVIEEAEQARRSYLSLRRVVSAMIINETTLRPWDSEFKYVLWDVTVFNRFHTSTPSTKHVRETFGLRAMWQHQMLQRKMLHKSFPMVCDDACDIACGRDEPAFSNSRVLGHVWAACQVELTCSEGRDGTGTSEHFNMQTLRASLNVGLAPDIGHLSGNMLMPYCRCGRFYECYDDLASREVMYKEPHLDFDEDSDVWALVSFIEPSRFSEHF